VDRDWLQRKPVKLTWTIIGVAGVPQSFKWYQSLLGLPETSPAHDDFGQIVDSDGTVLLCLHEWGAHEHPSLASPHYAKPGNGLLLFFRVDNIDVALPRARALVGRLEEEPTCQSQHWNYGVFAPRSRWILCHH
jgi:catechol 2,3-dioxygenase-like lactoylglutathione lyase family enzyme